MARSREEFAGFVDVQLRPLVGLGYALTRLRPSTRSIRGWRRHSPVCHPRNDRRLRHHASAHQHRPLAERN
jgi:hypothetical protein